MARVPALPSGRPGLAPLTPYEFGELPEDDQLAEVFLYLALGWRVSKIARHLDVSAAVATRLVKRARLARRSRSDDVDQAIDRAEAITEAVVAEAYRAVQMSNVDLLSKPAYLRLMLDGAHQLLRIRGLDKPVSAGSGRSRVVVRIGGREGQPPIDVGVEVGGASGGD